MLNGYIYIRCHESYEKYNACKLGRSANLPERDSTYTTGEMVRGVFVIAFGIHPPNTDISVEKKLQKYLKKFNVRINGGIEFFEKKIIGLIEPFLQYNSIHYTKLTTEYIDEIIRTHRERHTRRTEPDIPQPDIPQPDKPETSLYTPRNDQQIIIDKTVQHLQDNNKGLLIIPCGVGKTLISLWVIQKMEYKKILIGVPNTLLLKQWEMTIETMFDSPIFIVNKGVTIKDIMKFIKTYRECIVITTYSSSYKVEKASINSDFVFDIKINDEAHHLATGNVESLSDKRYINILKVPSVKQLSLTATIKCLEKNKEDETISNDNVEIFGKIICKKCLLEAIQENTVCDYEILTMVVNDDFRNFKDIDDNDDKRLLISAYITLKSIAEGHIHHTLIYANTRKNSDRIMEHIQTLLEAKYFQIPDLYYSSYDGEMRSDTQAKILSQFQYSAKGIISCVFCLGEGWDFPLLNGVVFAENMSSNIRIVQSALRASRKDNNDPAKITKIIIPILYQEDWYNNIDNTDFQKVKEVVYQMGQEDETIEQKIKVFQFGGMTKEKRITHFKPFENYDDIATKELRLKCIHRSAFGVSYEKAKRIVATYVIKNKDEYFDLCGRDIRLSLDPEDTFKGSFKNWIDYLGIKRTFYEKAECIQKVNEYLKLYPEFKTEYLNLALVCEKLCVLDTMFPPPGLWIDYYGIIDLKELIIFKNKKKIKIKIKIE